MSENEATVQAVNDLLGVNLWDVRSFRADVRIDFDEHGRVLAAALTAPTPAVPERATETRDTLAAVILAAVEDYCIHTAETGYGYTADGTTCTGCDRMTRNVAAALAPVVARIEREAREDERERIAAVREYVADPGNWSALDGRRQHLLDLIDGEDA